MSGFEFLIPAAAGLFGNLFGGKQDKQAAQQTKIDLDKLRSDDLSANRQNYATMLRDARFNKTDPYSSSTWSTDPATGQMTQNISLNPAQQGLLDSTNQLKQSRMNAANKVNLASGDIDWNKLGLGHLASAIGAPGQSGGTTGKRPWADSPYSSAGGDYLNYMSRQPEGMSAFTPTPYQPGVLTQPRGSGVFTGIPSGGAAGLMPNQSVVDVAKLLQGG